MAAPFCPINRSQSPSRTNTAPTKLPSIPIATDLPSLIRSVNIIRDVLRNITTSLTVNNTYLSRGAPPPRIQPITNYVMSAYPDWDQVGTDTTQGFVYYKPGPNKIDKKQRAYVSRSDAVAFRNNQRDDDTSFIWRVKKPLDEKGSASDCPAFKEDFFERVVNVKWGKKLYLYLRINGMNGRFGTGLNPVEYTTKPDIKVTARKGVELIDEYRNPDDQINGGMNGFFSCLHYEPQQNGWIAWGPSYTIPPPEGPLLWNDGIMGSRGTTAEAAFESANKGLYTVYAYLKPSVGEPNNKSCPVTESQMPVASISSWNDHASKEQTYYTQMADEPVNFYSQEYEQVEYLYAIPAGDDLIEINISGVIESINIRDVSAQDGGARVYAAVFSTARERLTKVSDVATEEGFIDYTDDKLDPDHARSIAMFNGKNGSFKIKVSQDNRPASAQVDNYGVKYQPYKISFVPTLNSTPEPTEQPPIRLSLPATVTR